MIPGLLLKVWRLGRRRLLIMNLSALHQKGVAQHLHTCHGKEIPDSSFAFATEYGFFLIIRITLRHQENQHCNQH